MFRSQRAVWVSVFALAATVCFAVVGAAEVGDRREPPVAELRQGCWWLLHPAVGFLVQL